MARLMEIHRQQQHSNLMMDMTLLAEMHARIEEEIQKLDEK
jgi:hypothetical protein